MESRPGEYSALTENRQDASPGAEPNHQASSQKLPLEIRSGAPTRREELGRLFSDGIRWCLARKLGETQDLDVSVNTVLDRVTAEIARGRSGEPEDLNKLVLLAIRDQVPSGLAKARQERALGDTPGFNSASRTVTAMSFLDQEALRLFYVDQQTVEQICSKLNISGTYFCRLKADARSSYRNIVNVRSLAFRRTQASERDSMKAAKESA